jgi:hypothetical protein
MSASSPTDHLPDRSVSRFRRVAEWAIGPVPTTSRPWWEWAIAAAVVIVGTIVSIARIPVAARNVLWAEDASIFVQTAFEDRPFGGVFDPYAGYLHLFPRVVSLIVVNTAPLDFIPLVITIVACATTGLVAGATFVLLRSRIPQSLPRIAVATAIGFSSVAALEVNGTIANSHWYLLVGLFVALAAPQERTGPLILACVITALATLSDPLSAVFLPLALAHLVAGGTTRRRMIVPIAYLATLALQLAAAAGSTQESSTDSPTFDAMLRAVGYRVMLATAAGPDLAARLFATVGLIAIIAVSIIILALLAIGIAKSPRHCSLAVAGAAAGIGVFVIATTIRWFPGLDPIVDTRWGGSRYSLVPVCLLVIALAATLPLVTSHRAVLTVIGSTLAIIALVYSSATGWGTSARFVDTSWPSSLDIVAETCAADGTSDPILAAPTFAPKAFLLEVPCSRIESP